MDEKIGFCSRCGRTVRLADPGGTTQEDWDREATEVCRCEMSERRGEMNIGYCRFCGTSRMIENGDDMTQEDLNTEATRLCDCDKARFEAQKQRIMENYMQDLHLLFGEGDEKIIRFLIKAGALIIDGKIRTISMKLPYETSVKVSFRNNGLATSKTRKDTQEIFSYD